MLYSPQLKWKYWVDKFKLYLHDQTEQSINFLWHFEADNQGLLWTLCKNSLGRSTYMQYICSFLHAVYL